jgi:hypothetical protein
MKLTGSEIEDIRRMLPKHTQGYIADWLGCHRNTVSYWARILGMARRKGPIPPEHVALARDRKAAGESFRNIGADLRHCPDRLAAAVRSA